MDNVIYTAIFGDRDNLIEPSFVSNRWNYICITDRDDFKSDVWKIIIDKKRDNPVLKNRSYKMLFYDHFERSIYIDGNFNIIGDLNKINFDNDIALYSHMGSYDKRDTVAQEMKAALKKEKVSKNQIKKSLEFLKSQDYNIDSKGLICGGIIIRKNPRYLFDIMMDWYNLVEKYTAWGDQFFFNFIAWKYKLNFGIIPGDIRDNEFFKIRQHAK